MQPDLNPNDLNFLLAFAWSIAIGVLVLGLVKLPKVFKNSKSEYYKQK